jgi:integrase
MKAAELKDALLSSEGRAKLAQLDGDAPHYSKIGPGQYIGYRAKGGSWCARVRVQLPAALGEKAKHQQRYTTLDLPMGADYQQAVNAAWEWMAKEMGRRPRNAPGIVTVTDACAKYVENLRLVGAKDEKTIDAIVRMLRNATLDAIGAIECEKLVALDVTEWRERMLRGERVISLRDEKAAAAAAQAGRPAPAQRFPQGALKPSGVNRVKKQLFAALSWAADGGRITNRDWQLKRNLEETIDRPGLFIEPQHAEQLRAAAAEGKERHYLTCIMGTGARPVELERATRADLDLTGAVATIKLVSFKGRNAKRRERVCGIPASARAAFEYFAAGKIGKAPLFPFTHNAASLMFTAVAERAGLSQYQLYDTRHTRIASLLRKGTDSQTVAKQTGTSLQMIDRHYSKDIPNDGAAKVAAVGF